MYRLIIICLLLGAQLPLLGQQQPEFKARYFRQISNGDTTYYTLLPEFTVLESNREYLAKLSKYRHYVKETYALAVFVSDLYKEFNDSLSQIKKRKNQRKYLKEEKSKLFDEFSHFIVDMSLNEGRVFVKLVYRFSGVTTYEIIRQLQGNLKAFGWQALSRTGGADLKLTYDADYTDKVLEEVIKEVESGKLKPKPLPRASSQNAVAANG
jgi:hypothetical protein